MGLTDTDKDSSRMEDKPYPTEALFEAMLRIIPLYLTAVLIFMLVFLIQKAYF